MRVLSIGSDRRLFETGSAVRERALGYAKRVERLDTIVFSTETHGMPDRVLLADNARVYATQSRSRWRYIMDALTIAKNILIDETYDVVTTQDPFEAGLSGMLIARSSGAKLHVQVHTDFLHPAFARLSALNVIRRLIAQFVLRRADCVRAVSETLHENLQKKYATWHVIHTLPIFVDTEHFKNAHASFKLKETYPQFEHILLMVGRLEPEKRVPRALDALSRVIAAYPKTGLIIVGEGRERAKLQAYARARGLSDNAVFVGWQQDLVSYYKGVDLMLVTSAYEGYGMNIIEALASGCPVLSTDVGIAKEAGARVAKYAEFSEIITAFLGGKRFSGTLKNYPYKSRSEYEAAIVTHWKRCLA